MNYVSTFVEITDELIRHHLYDEAEKICNNILLDADKNNSMAWNQLGGIYFSKGDLLD